MKKFRYVNNIIIMNSLLVGILLAVIFVGCGKLSNDTNRPTDPVGTTGGSPLPTSPQASVGTYTLTLTSDSDSLLADMTNYVTLQALLEDTSGRSVEGFTVNFETSGNLGWFYDTDSSQYLSTDTSFTDSTGLATTRFYGSRSGEAVIQASIDLDGDAITDLATTKTIVLNSSGQPSSAGNYKLVITAKPDTIPADMATYSAIVAKLYDSSGGSVENFVITFTAELGYLENDPDGPSTLATSLTALTDKSGGSSVYFYGARKGSAVISASVYVDDLVGTLQAKTIVLITEGPGVPGTNVPGIDLSVDPVSTIIDLGTCGEEEPEEVTFNFTATVWDETGDEVGEGVRVEISGDGLPSGAPPFAYTNSQGIAEWEITWEIASPGTYSKTLTAHVTINDVEYTDTVIFTVVATCDEEEEEGLKLDPLASPESIGIRDESYISVLVTDANGIVVGQRVTFAVNNDSLGYVDPRFDDTDESGVARTTFTARTTTGTVTIYITAGTVSTTLEVTIE
ncbi:MAG: hypothetical protein JW701_05920 [Kosmotogaceae bacterium]|nr:hypothetical protein [Kosmotogaceae bacterium]